MSSRTTWSPKRLLRLCASNRAILSLLRELRRDGRLLAEDLGAVPLPRAGHAFRLEEHHDDEEQAVPEEPRLGQGAEQIARHDEYDGADDRTPEAHQASSDERCHHDEAGSVHV